MLAAQLGALDLVDVRDPVAAVHAVLARSQSGWLVVFDNAPDLASVEAFLPPAGPGRVLLTSQSQHWPSGWAVQVPVLDPAVAAGFLTAGSGDVDQGAALELAAELGGLPLALEQAAAYMQATGTSLARYLRLFRVRQADLLARGEAAGHREHVAATLGLALSRLGKDAPAAAGLMRLLAFLAPEPVPLGLLLAEDERRKASGCGRDAGSGGGQEAGAAAGRSGGGGGRGGGAAPVFAGGPGRRRADPRAPAGAGRHPRAAHRPGEGQWQRAAAALVEAAIPADVQLPRRGRPVRCCCRTRAPSLTLTSRGIWRVAQSLGYSGSYTAARDLFVVIAAAHRDSAGYGPEHPVTLSARYELAVLDRASRGMRPGPGTSTPPCCPSASGSWDPSTCTP